MAETKPKACELNGIAGAVTPSSYGDRDERTGGSRVWFIPMIIRRNKTAKSRRRKASSAKELLFTSRASLRGRVPANKSPIKPPLPCLFPKFSATVLLERSKIYRTSSSFSPFLPPPISPTSRLALIVSSAAVNQRAAFLSLFLPSRVSSAAHPVPFSVLRNRQRCCGATRGFLSRFFEKPLSERLISRRNEIRAEDSSAFVSRISRKILAINLRCL